MELLTRKEHVAGWTRTPADRNMKA
ncbi:hypothetical protein PLANTIT3_60304 [Plantibacter sp. T3]|nr:hypothetical protein PLANTIT3_60304 [Plantibacter sp. T3]